MRVLRSVPRPRWSALAFALLVPLAACTDQPTAVAGDALLNKGTNKGGGGGGGGNSSDPVVASVQPAYGQQGETNKKVIIYGSGFDDGSDVAWTRGGTPAQGITTNQTRFISASELEADITIAEDAELDLYDVVITTSKVRSGIGTEMFEVTTAESFGTLGGNTSSSGMNDSGEIVGYSMVSSTQHAYVWDNSKITSLGRGIAHGIVAGGTMVVGASGGNAVIWIKGADGSWTQQRLPSPDLGGTATSVTPDGTLIVGRVEESISRRATLPFATMWRATPNGWQRTRLTTPDGFYSWAHHVIENGQVVGTIRRNGNNSSPQPAVWELEAGEYRLTELRPHPGHSSGQARTINRAGTIIAGHSDGIPAYWQKTATGWSHAQLLQTIGGSCGNEWVAGVNDLGWFVGRSCNGSSIRATLWRPEKGYLREELPGLGYSKDGSGAGAISNGPTPVIAGAATQRSIRVGVTWIMH